MFISKYNDSQFQCIEAKRALKAVYKKDGGWQPDSERAKCNGSEVLAQLSREL